MISLDLIIQSLGVIAAIWLIAVVKKIPDSVSDKIRDERNFTHTKELQIDNFFRQNSGSKMQEVLIAWVEILNDPNKVEKMSKNGGIQKLLNNTVGYSSPKTVKLMGLFFQSLYSVNSKTSEDELSDMSSLVYVAMIASSLKYDFSGENINPIDLLRIKFNDYALHEQEMLESQKMIKKALES